MRPTRAAGDVGDVDDDDANVDGDGNVCEVHGTPCEAVEVPERICEAAPAGRIRDATGGTARLSQRAWRFFDSVDLEAMKKHRVATFQFIPKFLRGSLMGAYRMCLGEIMRHPPRSEGCSRAWKAFLCIPRMLLASKIGGGKVERQSLRDRFLLF